ncbi:unnamed protein product [Leptidea sinapis]|uniref:MI domain-containing protein n=1 Tax=Leptidea sinapis TaxID=189913 RepID=A0A5E4R354_9NEOP|nr:unnamed protein product [Leptidea sinapis]
MSGIGNQLPLAPSQCGPGTYPRASTPHMTIPANVADRYHPGGAAGPGYMGGNGTAGAQPPAQTMRAPSAPQPSAPPPPEMSKTTMAGHNYASTTSNASQPGRHQYLNFQFRAAQHSTRPNSHGRQQQQYIPGAGSTSGGPVMYHHPMLFQTAHIPIQQTYQTPRSTTPGGYYQYMPYLGYSPTGHAPPYYYGNGQQVGANGGGRASQSPLVVSNTPTPTPMSHVSSQLPHVPLNVRQLPAKRLSHRVPIINPITQQSIFTEEFSNDNQNASGESSERQTPQPQDARVIVEQFNRMVSAAAMEPSKHSPAKSNYALKDYQVPDDLADTQLQENEIITLNINEKSDMLNDSDVSAEQHDVVTPVVSAVSDIPLIVPKSTVYVTNSNINEQSQSIVDSKFLEKPNVPQNETQSDVVILQDGKVEVQPYDQTALELQPSEQQPEEMKQMPQTQKVRETKERTKLDEKQRRIDINDKNVQELDVPKRNGPASVVISSIDSNLESINSPTSQNSTIETIDSLAQIGTKHKSSTLETEPLPSIISDTNKRTFLETQALAAKLLPSFENIAKDFPTEPAASISEESASPAQAKLTQSIVSAARNNTDTKMKDINLNNTNADATNGNMTSVAEPINEGNKTDKRIKNLKNNSKKNKNASSEQLRPEEEVSQENGENETDKVDENMEIEEEVSMEKPEETPARTVPVPKYKYGDDQWSPSNTSGKKCYNLRLLMQIKDDPLSKDKPNAAALLETWNVLRPSPIQDSMVSFNQITRPVNDSLFPNFLKNTNVGMRNTLPRDSKKEGWNAVTPGKGSMKLSPPSSGGSGAHKNVIVVSLSLREEVKLNKSDDAWKPSRFKKEDLSEEEVKTQELYKKFRGILNKLTPQKFETLLDRVKTLEINTQARLQGVIDLVFEKAIDEPNFSEAYAAMCSKLSTLKVPSANNPNQRVNFLTLIITKCQNQFIAEKVDEQVMKREKELAECTDPAKKKELQLLLEEELRRCRMRSVGNVRFIGELYKLKMLTPKIMVYCMDYLIKKLEEEKLECLCKLLTTVGEQVESEVKDQVEGIFKNMQDIVEKKANKISSRVRFMLQDVIELRRRKWVSKNVVDSQPKMMDQIQKEAEQHQRNIELMNTAPMGGGGGFRRDDGGRGKRGERGDGRRQNANSFMDNNWKTNTRNSYVVDTTKLKAATNSPKNLSSIKLAPPAWNHSSNIKSNTQTASNSMISLNKNMYSILENNQTDPTSLIKDMTPAAYTHSKSIERSTFNSTDEFSPAARSGSTSSARSELTTRSPPPAPSTPVTSPQEPVPEEKKKLIKQMVEYCCLNNDANELVEEIKLFGSHHHAAIISEILNVALEMSAKEIVVLSEAVLHVVSSGTIAPEHFAAGLTESLEFAPDSYIDVPMLYEYLGKFITPQLIKKNITLKDVHQCCDTVIAAKQGHLLLRAILKELIESMGVTFTRNKWNESGLQFNQWMPEEMVPKWLENNKLEFLENKGEVENSGKSTLTQVETQNKLLQLMNSDESCECIRGWIKDCVGEAAGEEWFMRVLTQAICEHALAGGEHLNHERMNKFAPLIGEFGDEKPRREAACLYGVQHLIHKLEHPQGLTLDIFQYLHEQYIISVEGFIAWETSETEPEGKAVMLKALTSFFTNIKEADNEDSCSEA